MMAIPDEPHEEKHSPVVETRRDSRPATEADTRPPSETQRILSLSEEERRQAAIYLIEREAILLRRLRCAEASATPTSDTRVPTGATLGMAPDTRPMGPGWAAGIGAAAPGAPDLSAYARPESPEAEPEKKTFFRRVADWAGAMFLDR